LIDEFKVINENIELLVGAFTENEEYVLGGYIFHPDDTPSYWQPYIIKLDIDGNMVWELEIEGYNYFNAIEGIGVDSETGNIYCSGTVESIGNQANVLFLEISPYGEILIEKKFSTTVEDFGGDLIVDENHVFERVGYKQNNIRYSQFVKRDFNGFIVWETDFTAEDNIGGFTEIVKGIDDHYYLSMEKFGTSWDAGLAKFNSWGQLLWHRTYGGEGNDYAYAIETDSNGAIYLTGRTESNTDGADVLLIKTNCMGLFTEPAADYDYVINETQVLFENLSQYVYPDSIDGGHYIWDFGDGNVSSDINSSHNYDATGAYEVTLTAIVCQDTSVYSTCIYLEENSLCCAEVEAMPIPAFSLETTDSLSISLENISSNLYEEYNNGAYILWNFGDGNTSTEFSPNHTFAEANYYDVTLSVILCGDTTSVFETVKVGEPVGIETIDENTVRIHPNPTTNSLTIEYHTDNNEETLLLYNALGQLVHEVLLPPASNSQIIDVADFVAGVYYWRLGRLNGKLVKQ